MRKYMLVLMVLLIPFFTGAKEMTTETNARMQQIEDKIALKELVDTFSILADQKATKEQVELFADTATIETIVNGASVSKLQGKEQIGSAFEHFLSNFDMVYHFNGQHKVTINGDHASGTLYCLVSLFGSENGKKFKTSIGVRYNDEYVRKNGVWLINKRTSFFDWQEKDERH
ncbi:nuclear transport factor 2 family protein [uncultured Tolumonas sp.]|uniref:nuclear transport factor 2 family protein n=1 Tax=uncultured Tolumonas sp. TaxID=263765 RepID=UPI00293109A6|nr:nuclear transport factor 2 family protein [uncultured Tolumonas sp.]